MRLAHYYHCYAIPGWKPIMESHLNTLIANGLPEFLGAFNLGIVGTKEQRQEVIDYCNTIITTNVVNEADSGWEQVTLIPLWKDAGSYDYVLYAHTKGVTLQNRVNTNWRQSMTNGVVRDWAKCVEALQTHDAAGLYWLTPEQWPNIVSTPFFGGNFWWATTRLIQQHKSEPPVDNRCQAESWLAQNILPRPKVFNLLDGWPDARQYA